MPTVLFYKRMITLKYGFIKTAAASPKIRVADCDYNAEQIIKMSKDAYEKGASLIVFPELCVTGYTCGDLFLQNTLIKSAEEAVAKIVEETKDVDIILVVGAPIAVKHSLYNCGIVIYKGEILGAVPKTHLPSHSEFSEGRYFSNGEDFDTAISYANQDNVWVSANIIFTCLDFEDFSFGVEICEDLWVASSPSIRLAENGATIICNLSSSNALAGKCSFKRDLVKMQSAKLFSAYIYSDSSIGESTTDLVFAGQNIIAENSAIVAESKGFKENIIYADIDVQKLASERKRITTFYSENNDNGVFDFCFDMKLKKTELSKEISQTPFIPTDKTELETRCEEILQIQTAGLVTRLESTGIKNVVLGLSGGLDSTLALIACVHAFDELGIDRKNIHTVTMPCFGTTKRTKSNAEKLAEAYGVSFEEINITNAVRQHFSDIGHDETVTDVTYENSQARERTQVLMDLSNKYNGLVIGTGDLSELALGWATYNGDHMSMYGVNASIPKTFIRYLTAYEAQKSEDTLKQVLLDILDTPVSPELLPPDKDGEIAQKTEDVVGPYELHDFFLYYMVRYGFTPSKIYYMAKYAFSGKYDSEVIKKWLKVFLRRFFTQQFKRSCLPDGPKVGSISLSPRGDFRMPSDASYNMWLKDLENAE